MRYLSLFSGIGAFEKALERLGVKYELVGFSEIDKYAVKSYCAVHGVNEELNLGDITTLDINKLLNLDIDLITHGSPCQDFSIAGLQAGGDKGSETRSSLMWRTVEIVEKVKPKYVLWENVKNIMAAKHRHNFDSYISIMSDLGYNSYYQVLNAKDYGIPQNRERIFTVSIRKDVDLASGYKFEFPEEQELKLKLKDMLEENVDKKYYLSEKMLNFFKKHNEKQAKKGNGFKFKITEGNCIAKSITTRVGACRTDDNYIGIKVIGMLDMKGLDCIKRVYDIEGLSPTLTNMQGGHRQPKIMVGAAMRGRYNSEGKVEQQIEISNREQANAITTVQKDSLIGELSDEVRVRKLTPKECWRLMGFDDEDFEKAKAVGISDTQLYKQARKFNCG